MARDCQDVALGQICVINSSSRDMTNNNQEIDRAAQHMVERYGDHALHEIELRILELEAHGEAEALELWRAVRERVASIFGGSSKTDQN